MLLLRKGASGMICPKLFDVSVISGSLFIISFVTLDSVGKLNCPKSKCRTHRLWVYSMHIWKGKPCISINIFYVSVGVFWLLNPNIITCFLYHSRWGQLRSLMLQDGQLNEHGTWTRTPRKRRSFKTSSFWGSMSTFMEANLVASSSKRHMLFVWPEIDLNNIFTPKSKCTVPHCKINYQRFHATSPHSSTTLMNKHIYNFILTQERIQFITAPQASSHPSTVNPGFARIDSLKLTVRTWSHGWLGDDPYILGPSAYFQGRAVHYFPSLGQSVVKFPSNHLRFGDDPWPYWKSTRLSFPDATGTRTEQLKNTGPFW